MEIIINWVPLALEVAAVLLACTLAYVVTPIHLVSNGDADAYLTGPEHHRILRLMVNNTGSPLSPDDWRAATEFAWKLYTAPLRRELATIGGIGVFSGLVVGFFVPTYLELKAVQLAVCLLLGGAMFFPIGVGFLTWLKWGYAGSAIGMVGFGSVLQYIAMLPLGPGPLAWLKMAVVVALLEASVYLGLNIGRSAHATPGAGPKLGERVANLIGAILTLLSFFNILYDLWLRLDH